MKTKLKAILWRIFKYIKRNNERQYTNTFEICSNLFDETVVGVALHKRSRVSLHHYKNHAHFNMCYV